jgi:hypothetical protein
MPSAVHSPDDREEKEVLRKELAMISHPLSDALPHLFLILSSN